MAEELNNRLSGGRIGKIQQIKRDTIILHIRASGENYRLLISSNASSPRIHLTWKQYESPNNPPVFCMVLRKHLSGARILGFKTAGFERVIIMEAEAMDELGDRSIKRLAVEIMGKHSNIILLNKDNRIIDAIRHVDSQLNRVRELLPARTYVAPPAQNKLDPSSENTYQAILDGFGESNRRIEKYLLDKLQGFSPVLCRELCSRALIDERKPASDLNPDEAARLIDALRGMMRALLDHGPTPVVIKDHSSDKAIDFHVTDLVQYPAKKRYETISQAIDDYYHSRLEKEAHSQRAHELMKTVGKLVEKCEKRLAANIQAYEDNKDYERLRLYGELITSSIYNLKKGMSSARIPNYHSEDQEFAEIPLDPKKSPQENAQYYFKCYGKARTAFNYAVSQIENLKIELSWLESVMLAIERAENSSQLHDIRLELYEQGYLKSYPRKGRRSTLPESSPIRIVSSDGFEIFIGRNNKQNDRLTLKSAKHEDIWLHVKNYPGSHVIIKTDGRQVPNSTLEEAAGYAAWFSKARPAPKVEVDYTHIRNVKKPSGAKPGMVIYENYSTIMVTPKAPETSGG
jgi:predicted ribosome quality control (RQC) complex YloA/Tae2 family protein